MTIHAVQFDGPAILAANIADREAALNTLTRLCAVLRDTIRTRRLAMESFDAEIAELDRQIYFYRERLGL